MTIVHKAGCLWAVKVGGREFLVYGETASDAADNAKTDLQRMKRRQMRRATRKGRR